jgi:transposase
MQVAIYVALEYENPQRVDEVREEAIALRHAGKSIREIKDALGPVGKRTLTAALKGTTPAEWTLRPNAKDDLREKARELRTRGLSYNEIVAQLGVSKSSVSLWVRDIPCPKRFRYVHNKRRLEGLRKYNEARAAVRTAETEAAAAEIGELTDREMLIAWAIAYWCEGTKSKPYRQAAQRFWVEVTGVSPSQFRSPTLKRHNPKTVRMNVGGNYHGCLRIDARRSGEFYRKIEGWASGVMAA